MKLSTLIHYRNLLKEHTPGDMSGVMNKNAGHALYLAKEHELQFSDLTTQLDNDYQNIIQSFSKFSNTITDIQDRITHLINEIEPQYYSEISRAYKYEWSRHSVNTVFERKLPLTDGTAEYIRNRIKLYGGWQYPGLIVRPALDPWIKDLVACDPLYIADQNLELLQPALEQFHEQYQNRLRIYFINDYVDAPILKMLPENQFGFCLFYNFFNYKPIEIVKNYLSEIYRKLRPGGVLAFTFNDCDHHNAVELVERNYMSYTPGHLIFDFCKHLNYELVQTQQIVPGTSWVELKKPGALSSLRGGQSLARIVAKSK